MKKKIPAVIFTLLFLSGSGKVFSARENPQITSADMPITTARHTASELSGIYVKRIAALIEEYERSFPSLKGQWEGQGDHSFMSHDEDNFLAGYSVGDMLKVAFYFKDRVSPGSVTSYRFDLLGVVLELETKLPDAESFRFFEIGKEFAAELMKLENFARDLTVAITVEPLNCVTGDTVRAVINIKNSGKKSIMLKDLVFDRKSVWWSVSFPDTHDRWTAPERVGTLKSTRLEPGEELQMWESFVMTSPGTVTITGYYGGLYAGKMTEGYYVATQPVSVTVANKETGEAKYPKRYADISVALNLNATDFVVGGPMPATLTFRNATSEERELNYFYFEEGEIPTLSFLEVQGHDILRIKKKGEEQFTDIKVRPASKPHIAKKILQPEETYVVSINLGKYLSAYRAGDYQAIIIYGDETLQTEPVELSLVEK